MKRNPRISPAATPEITAEYVQSIIDYDRESGTFTWRKRVREHFQTQMAFVTWNARYSGKSAGTFCDRGYLTITIHNRHYYGHRLAWLWMTDKWPAHEIDHIDGCHSNNRWVNLREATRSENECNKGLRSDNTSGVKGVCWNRQRSKWQAGIEISGRRRNLGLFYNIEDAVAAYERAARELHGEFARVS